MAGMLRYLDENHREASLDPHPLPPSRYLPGPEAEWGHDPHLVTLCPAQPDRLWQQNHSGVFTREDGARSWKRVSQKEALPGLRVVPD